MKFAIQQNELQKALDIIANVVPAKTTLPILTCVLMEAKGGRLTLSATNLDISITTSTGKVEIKDEGRVAIPATKFVPFVRSLRSGEVTISQKGEQIRLDSGKARLTENTMNAEEYPKLKPLAEKDGLEIDAASLIDMINETSYAVSRDETRPALMGILWEIRGASLTLVATDAHRLARSARTMEWDASGDRNVIVDTAGLRQLPRIVASLEGDEAATVTMFLGENQLSFRAGDTVLHTRLLEGPFPDYSAVIPKDNDKHVTVDKAEFVQAIRRVSITADRITSQIRLGIEKGRMELGARGTEGSQSEDELAVSYDGAALEIGFNFNYLQDILKNLRSDTVTLSLRDAQSAALLRPVGEDGADAGVLCLLMPLRLAGD
ncbi:MAG TPA: DNA polymerase III subunit beta [Candidatus Krumholzibacteria bacterium]|nr:DNA polymerase III subunit beta [Candidatus Krumholzibacteria bacterium]